MSEKIYGIDLGTTNSCISVIEDGHPRVIPIEGDGIVPSVVSFDGREILVGRKARNRAVAFPEQSICSVKRLMGKPVELKLGDKTYEPEDISSMILRYLCDEARRLEGRDVRRVVITVPAYFSDAQRRAAIDAGSKAGLSVERIINEPTAAALFYDHVNLKSRSSGSSWKHALVYDLGGGTFDVSVLRMNEIIEVLSSTGDTQLGGDDFDRCLVDLALETLNEGGAPDLSEYAPALARMSIAAENAKIRLSSKATALIEETNIPTPDGHGCTLSLEISREEFVSLTSRLLERTLDFVRKALDEAKLRASDIDRVLLVGGMTRMPVVSAMLSSLFGDASMPPVDPDLSVSQGAAIQGGIITGENVEQILLDVTSHTLSLAAWNEYTDKTLCVPIIPRNTPIPANRARQFWTSVHNQKIARLEVYQGESEEPEDNTLIGKTELRLARSEAETPIIVEYAYDLNGIIHLMAEQKGYSKRTEVRFDSRQPQISRHQELEIMDDDEEDEEMLRKQSSPINFVVHRARELLKTMPDGADKGTFAALAGRYEQALLEDSDEIDDLEDELLSAMDNL
ncbi:MAG: Hsp70 family protein [Synergistaceae bacterium]|jgi:molecular chaperone DnaK|nr:Hsp70 family protein [Synergistaceae bacterium]